MFRRFSLIIAALVSAGAVHAADLPEPVARLMQSSLDSSVRTKIHSPATHGVSPPPTFSSHMRCPAARSIATIRPPWPIA